MKNNKEKLKFKKIYIKVNHNPYCQITNILKKCTLKSNVKNLFTNSWKVILITLLILLAIFIYTFWNNLIAVLYCVLLILFFFIATICFNSYKISLGENELKYKINFQENIISYDNLGNIFMGRDCIKFFFIPIYFYNIKVTYLTDNEHLGMLSFPVFMLNKKDILKFFSAFEVEAYKDEKEEIEKEKNNRKNFYKAIGIGLVILFIALFIMSIFIYIFTKK